MCGIIGYIGAKQANVVLHNALLKMEYRGYDSCGIALINKKNDTVHVYKDACRIEELLIRNEINFENNVGMGHTRWATHGRVCMENSHPHYSKSKRFLIVHNGVIVNYKELVEKYLFGETFYSTTDSEIIAHLIEKFSDDGMLESLKKTCSLLKGSYAFIVIDKEEPNKLYCAKNKSPLLVGLSDESIYVASDIMALEKCNKYVKLEDKTIVIVDETVTFYNYQGELIDIEYDDLNIFYEDISKNNYETYMLKEICEQPQVILEIKNKYIEEGKIRFNHEVEQLLNNFDEIYFLGCGTSYHASLQGVWYLRKHNIKASAHIASEFIYNMPIISKKPLFILISQSGETHDLLSSYDVLKKKYENFLLITNNKDSTLSTIIKNIILMHASYEVAVASTKTYIASSLICYLIAKYVSNTSVNNELDLLSEHIKQLLDKKEYFRILSNIYLDNQHAFFMGRGIDYYTSLEGSLKLKEISYIHSEAFPSGELKHGSIALIEEGTPIIAIITSKNYSQLVRSNIEEVKTRNAKVLVIASSNVSDNLDQIIIKNIGDLTSLLTVIPCQLLAYYSSVRLGLDVDKPRNLAKSVTVE